MLALWGLATSHCSLEQLPGLEFLACCPPPDKAPHQDNDCEQDGCSSVESGFYKVEAQTAFAPAPRLVVSFILSLWEAQASSVPPSPTLLSSSPPELPRVWQFSFRTALPPRAPPVVA